MRARLGLVSAVAAATLLPLAAAAKDCEDLTGPFSAVPPPSCSSPVGLCTHGTLTGGLPSTYDFVADTLTSNGPDASLTGHSTVTLDQGGAVLLGQDTSALSLATGAFTTTVHIVGGTHQYKRASGTIVAVGVLDLATGATSGTYTAHVCKHKDDSAE